MPTMARRLPAHVVNGITVAMGIGLVQLVCTLLFDVHVASLASTGAIYASLPHLAVRSAHTWRRVLAGGVIGSVVAVPVVLLRAFPTALGPAIALLAFAASMGMVLEGRYRTLAVAASIRATAQLLRARARVLVEPIAQGELSGSRLGWVGDEASLAELLQAARDLVFTAADTPRNRRESAVLLHTIDLRDTLLASRLDLHLLGEDATARDLRERLAKGLGNLADALDAAHVALRDGKRPPPEANAEPHTGIGRVFRDATIEEDDPRTRLLPAMADRLEHLADDVTRIRGLLRGTPDDVAPPPQSSDDSSRRKAGRSPRSSRTCRRAHPCSVMRSAPASRSRPLSSSRDCSRGARIPTGWCSAAPWSCAARWSRRCRDGTRASSARRSVA